MPPTATAERAARIERLSVTAYRIPTDEPESDGTLEWDSTSMVLVEARADGHEGIGWTYAHPAAAAVIEDKVAPLLEGHDPLRPGAAWETLQVELRQLGHAGLAAMAVSAVDVALWDLKARLLGVPLADLLARFHDRVPVYGSGGFTSYSPARLEEQLGGWAAQGIASVKMKVGRDPSEDERRVRAAREAIGDETGLMVDANGAYTRTQALDFAERFRDLGVTWFEEPVSSDDLGGLASLRSRAPAGMAIAAGEYGWDLVYFERMLAARAVDVLQADVTRCGGITGLLRVDGLCKAAQVPFSAHCAPSIHAHACTAMETLAHLEYFHDHARVEHMLFDGALSPERGCLTPDPSRPGLGLELRRADAEHFRVPTRAGS